MLPRRWRLRAAAAPVVPVLITSDARHDGVEGVIERVEHLGPSVTLKLLLADGTEGHARLEVSDWDWLELRVGDIVPVCRLSGVPVSV